MRHDFTFRIFCILSLNNLRISGSIDFLLMLLELTDLTVSYGKKVVLDNLNLQIKGGAIGLLGLNGAGKSTLIKTLLGFWFQRMVMSISLEKELDL